MKNDKRRKQIRFKTDDEVKAINMAVEIIRKDLTQGENVTFSSFVRVAGVSAALEVIKAKGPVKPGP